MALVYNPICWYNILLIEAVREREREREGKEGKKGGGGTRKGGLEGGWGCR